MKYSYLLASVIANHIKMHHKLDKLLLSKNKLIICAYENLHYQISREKFKPKPGLKLGPQDL